jgi:hypothetical protein
MDDLLVRGREPDDRRRRRVGRIAQVAEQHRDACAGAGGACDLQKLAAKLRQMWKMCDHSRFPPNSNDLLFFKHSFEAKARRKAGTGWEKLGISAGLISTKQGE